MMRPPMNRVDATLASAGTGKTHMLADAIARAIADGADPAKVVATTFSVRAAAELVGRVRALLVAEGRADAAAALLNSRVGTVNAVCGRIANEFSFELGRSVATDVIPQEGLESAFAMAADGVIAAHAHLLHPLAEALGLPDRDVDWRAQVSRIVDLARSNGVPPERFADCAERSVDGLLALLPSPADATGEQLDERLRMEVEAALAVIGATSLKASSLDAAEAVRAAAACFSRGGPPPWPLWAKLAKAKAAKADQAVFAGVARAAAAHPGHPRLRHDLAGFVRISFVCAGAAHRAYQAYKEACGLIDFADQEVLALRVLEDPANADRLRETVGHVFVDEFQDSSPLQVAVFAALARIAPRSHWVGDPKQAVYGFRGTDPFLTLAAAREAAATTGGRTRVLSRSWRSRPELCAFVNSAFVPAFEAMGLSREESSFSGAVRLDDNVEVPPLTVWHLVGRSRCEHAASVAGGILDALSDPASWPIRSVDGVRGLRSGDVAVLCRDNADVAEVASALSRLGLPVAAGRGSLFASPEAQAVASCLRWVADRDDRLALVELVRLLGDPCRPAAWLEALGAPDPTEELTRNLPFATQLDSLRDRQASATPAEVVDLVIMVTGIVDRTCRWGSAAERLRNLAGVRGAAADYEAECRRLRSPATVPGLVAWLAERRPALPGSRDPAAVEVMTYHAAKGLEWPVVVLCQLHTKARSSPFDVAVECDAEPDCGGPLSSRWLRLWPWPYGRQEVDVGLDAAASGSEVGRLAARRARNEAVRLLYVGATRARDHLALGVACGPPAAWLALLDVEGANVFDLPEPGAVSMTVGGRPHPARCHLKRGSDAPSRELGLDVVHLPATPERTPRRPLRVAAREGAVLEGRKVRRIRLGERLALLGSPETARLGEAVHAILAADDVMATAVVRAARAEAVLGSWGVAGALRAADAVIMSDRLWAFLDSRFPRARIRREAPFRAKLGMREAVGRVDLLIEAPESFSVVDHKSFAGPAASWEDQSLGHFPQLDLYARAVTAVTGLPCRGRFVHMPLLGAIVEIMDARPS